MRHCWDSRISYSGDFTARIYCFLIKDQNRMGLIFFHWIKLYDFHCKNACPVSTNFTFSFEKCYRNAWCKDRWVPKLYEISNTKKLWEKWNPCKNISQNLIQYFIVLSRFLNFLFIWEIVTSSFQWLKKNDNIW